ncbi:MAG: hypothetical protein GYA50_01990 [Eubacteriaceae bacterium]|nr:hypothetical protein [Eubacteriaceae bacterium]
MRELIRLTVVSLKNVYGLSAMLYDVKKNKKSYKKIILFFAVLIALVPAYALYIFFTSIIYDSYAMLNQTSAYLAQFLALGAFVILIFGISYILSYFYMSKDLDTLLSLPVSPRNIILSKILTITFSEYFFIVPMMLPPIIKYGIAQHCNVIYYLQSVIAMALLPVTVLGILAIIIILIMQGASLKIKKDKLQIITLFLTLAFIIAIQFANAKFSSSMGSGNQAEIIAYYLQNSNAMLSSITKIFFPAVIASNAMVNYGNISGIYYLFLYIVTCGAVLFICSAIGSKIYIKSILKSSFSNKSKSNIKNIDLKTASPLIAIFKNDMRLILRTPIYMFNSIGLVIVFPVVILITAFASGISDKIDLSIVNSYKEISVLVLTAVYTFFVGLTPTLSTTFSREGQCFWITKTMPATVNEQINGRLLTHIILSVLFLLASSITIFIITKLSIYALFLAFVLGIFVSMPTAYIALLIDTKRPLLVWDNPQRAVKQNMNVVVAMLISLVYILLLGVIGYFSAVILNVKMAIIIILAISILLTFLFDSITRKKFKIWFLKIEI